MRALYHVLMKKTSPASFNFCCSWENIIFTKPHINHVCQELLQCSTTVKVLANKEAIKMNDMLQKCYVKLWFSIIFILYYCSVIILLVCLHCYSLLFLTLRCSVYTWQLLIKFWVKNISCQCRWEEKMAAKVKVLSASI